MNTIYVTSSRLRTWVGTLRSLKSQITQTDSLFYSARQARQRETERADRLEIELARMRKANAARERDPRTDRGVGLA